MVCKLRTSVGGQIASTSDSINMDLLAEVGSPRRPIL